MELQNFEWYSDEIKKSLDQAEYYLRFLHTEAEDKDKIAGIAERVALLTQELEAEQQRVYDEAEDNKTEEDVEKEKFVKAIKDAYFEETGKHLLLNDKDIMQEMRSEKQRLESDRKAYDAPSPDWHGFLTQSETKNKWVKSMTNRLEKIKQRMES